MRLTVTFGASKAGLVTVGYRLFDEDGADSQARTTTDVKEVGNGAYRVTIAQGTVPADAAGVEWDTGEASPVYAHDEIGVNVDSVANYEIEGAGVEGSDEWRPKP